MEEEEAAVVEMPAAAAAIAAAAAVTAAAAAVHLIHMKPLKKTPTNRSCGSCCTQRSCGGGSGDNCTLGMC